MRRTIESIQFLRFIAATLVTFSHSVGFLSTKVDWVPAGLKHLGAFGAAGVHLFFVISGFVMMYTSFAGEHLSPATFLTKRFIRIYPIYWFYAFLFLLFDYLFSGKGHSMIEIAGSLMLLPAYSASIIGQGWSLSYELYFYLCFALVLIRRSLIGLAALTGFFLLAVALRPLLATKEEFIALATSPLLIEFLAGVWIAYLLVTGWQVSRFTSHVLIVLSIALFAAGIAFGYTRLPSVITWGVPSALLVGGLVFAEHNEGLHRWLKMCSLLGDSSYSQYLLHGLIIEPLVVYALPNIKVPGGWIASIAICLVMPAICVALSVFSYEKVERKLAKFLQSKARNLRFYEVAQVPNQRRL